MKTSHQTWLREETRSWVEKDIITQEQADKILAEYPTRQILPMTFQRTFITIGAVLIGMGILLVLAHNWDTLARSVRLTTMMVLLLLSQAGTLLTAKTERFARFREGAALVQSLMVGAAILLVSQTYYIGMETSWLFGIWMVLILPIALLTETVLPVFAYIVIFFVWLAQASDAWYIWFSWPLLFALVPFQRRLEETGARGCRLLAWVMVAALSAAFLVCFRTSFGDFAVQIMAIFFFCLSALGVRLSKTDEFWNKPLFSLGLFGSLVCAFFLTFYSLWHRSGEVIFNASFFLLLGVIAVAGFFIWQHGRVKKGDWALRLSSLMVPVVGVTSILWILGMPDWLAVGIMNIYLFIIGIFLLTRGFLFQQVSVFNVGMLLVSALIIARLFDVEMDFLVRGVLYIVLGMIFLGVNYRMMKQKGGAQARENTSLQPMAGETENGGADAVGADDRADDRADDGADTAVERIEFDFEELVRTIRESKESFETEQDAQPEEPSEDEQEELPKQ